MLRERDPDLLEAVAEVDRATLDFAASLSPLARLHAGTTTAHALARFRREPPTSG